MHYRWKWLSWVQMWKRKAIEAGILYANFIDKSTHTVRTDVPHLWPRCQPLRPIAQIPHLDAGRKQRDEARSVHPNNGSRAVGRRRYTHPFNWSTQHEGIDLFFSKIVCNPQQYTKNVLQYPVSGIDFRTPIKEQRNYLLVTLIRRSME
jgi:hypothetical protein